MTVVKWTFTDVYHQGPTPWSYTFEINPNEGGSPEISKQYSNSVNVGPRHVGIVQEGQFTQATLTFSGVILTQGQYENLELWFNRRIVLDLVDDLGRTFRGSFSKFAPKRSRRNSHPYYHTYEAEFLTIAYKNASGINVYGSFS